MTNPDDRPDWSYEASLYAFHQASGLDAEQAALFAAADMQAAQSEWDQAHLKPIDGYSLLEGDYKISRNYGDPTQATLQRGKVSVHPLVPGLDYSGELFHGSGEDPLKARVVRLGKTTLHLSFEENKTYDVLALQYEGDNRIYPALGKTINYSGDDYGDGGACDITDEIAKLGYVHPGLFEPKERPAVPFLVAGRDYYRPGHFIEENEDGTVFVIEPDGTRWVARSSSGLSYSDPADLGGHYE